MVVARIQELLANGTLDQAVLLEFAEWIQGKPFPEPVLGLT
jgi:hypothetical protein